MRRCWWAIWPSAGFDNGRVAAVARSNGTTAWDSAVGQSHGSTELQRLIDVDAPIVADGDDLFAVAYQGRVARLARETGQVIWARDLSSYRGLAVDDNAVYIVNCGWRCWCVWTARTAPSSGARRRWQRRQLSAPVIYRGRVVVADVDGLVHWLDPATGDFIARARVGSRSAATVIVSKGISYKKRVTSPPIVAGGLLLVFSDAGELSAFRAPETVARRRGVSRRSGANQEAGRHAAVVAIVGRPNVGKSTLFNALTRSHARHRRRRSRASRATGSMATRASAACPAC